MRGERMLQQSTGLQLRSTVKKEGILELSLTSVPIPEPKPDEVVVRVDASPINPSDLGLMFGGADMSTAKVSGTLDNPIVTASIPPPMMKSMIGRMDQSLPVGNEGAGVVVRTGSADQAQALMGKTVAILGGAMFIDDLTEALVATGATLAFDAIGGGRLASQILSCMEAAANRTAREYSRYGSTTHKQVYIYGGLDGGPTELVRNFGMAWGLGGWLLVLFLQKIGPEAAQKLRERVASEIKTTFASHYNKEVSLAESLRLEEIAIYGKKATGQKYLINPNKGLAH